MTRVFISVDMEGVAGVATFDQIIRGGSGYPRAQELMTAEANAAIRGAFAAGADEVLVNDSHGTMDNLLHDRLDARARVVFGAPRPSCMVQGISAADAVAVFVGYHAAAGAPGVLAHTFSSNFTELRVNGAAMTEAEVNGLYAASMGVPVGVVTGDDEICDVARKAFPGVTTVEVKRANGYSAADSLAPEAAGAAIFDAVQTAVAEAPSLRPAAVPDRARVGGRLRQPADGRLRRVRAAHRAGGGADAARPGRHCRRPAQAGDGVVLPGRRSARSSSAP